MKRFISLLLVSAMLLGAVSCASDKGETVDKETGVSPEENVADATEETEKPYLDNLPEDLNFGGTDFNVLILPDRNFSAEELTGESVNDALFERSTLIEDRFGVKINPIYLGYDSGKWRTTISGSAQAADGAYDVVCPDYWWGIETGGYYIDLNSLPYLDFSQQYWSAGWNQNTEIYGKLYTAMGFYTLDLILNAEALFFNKELITNYNLENPYDLVLEDKWYLDTLSAMSETALTDLNGDGNYTVGTDRFGLICALHSGRGFLWCSGMKLAYKNDDGSWSVDYFNDRFVDIYNKVYTFINETPSVRYDTSADLSSAFASGNSLFYAVSIGAATTTQLRQMEDDYGIVPYPRLDELQENYISFNLGCIYQAVMTSAKDPSMSAAILEALNAESYKSVVPVLYEEALKGKYSRDATTAQMLDIVTKNLYFDFTFVNDAQLGAVCNYYFDSLVAKKNDCASLQKTRDKATKKSLEKFLAMYID